MYSSRILLYLLQRYCTDNGMFTETSEKRKQKKASSDPFIRILAATGGRGVLAAVYEAQLEEAGGAVVASGVIEAELGRQVDVGDGASVVDRTQRVDEVLGHFAQDLRVAPDLIYPDHR